MGHSQRRGQAAGERVEVHGADPELKAYELSRVRLKLMSQCSVKPRCDAGNRILAKIHGYANAA